MSEDKPQQEMCATPRVKASIVFYWFCPECGKGNVTTLSHWSMTSLSECIACERAVIVVER